MTFSGMADPLLVMIGVLSCFGGTVGPLVLVVVVVVVWGAFVDATFTLVVWVGGGGRVGGLGVWERY